MKLNIKTKKEKKGKRDGHSRYHSSFRVNPETVLQILLQGSVTRGSMKAWHELGRCWRSAIPMVKWVLPIRIDGFEPRALRGRLRQGEELRNSYSPLNGLEQGFNWSVEGPASWTLRRTGYYGELPSNEPYVRLGCECATERRTLRADSVQCEFVYS